MSTGPILVTGAGGRVGGVGTRVVEKLRHRGFPVRAFVHREDERSKELRAMGAEVFVGDLTSPADIGRALEGVRRMYFGMSVSPYYLEATATAAAVARQKSDLEVFVNISQMTVSQMSTTQTTNSHQQRQHWLAEQLLNWSGVPVVHVRATVFLQHFFFSAWAAKSIAKDNTIRLPFGNAKTSPVDTDDVAEVIATILEKPSPHIGKVYELTGPSSLDINSMAKAYSAALGKQITYVDTPFEQWSAQDLGSSNLPQHVIDHLQEMAHLHAANRYDRMTTDVEKIIGRKATSVAEYIKKHPEIFKASA